MTFWWRGTGANVRWGGVDLGLLGEAVCDVKEKERKRGRESVL